MQLEDVIRIVETWQTQKIAVFNRSEYKDGSNSASLREFIEIHNALSRRLITIFEKRDPDFYTSLGELCMNTDRIITGGKIFANGQDRTSEGM